jgi:hypothetical protein
MITEALVDIAITQLHFGTSEHKPQKGMRKGLGSFDYGPTNINFNVVEYVGH